MVWPALAGSFKSTECDNMKLSPTDAFASKAADFSPLQYEWVFICVLLFSAVSLYANTLQNGFVWDDRAAIMSNEDVHGLRPLSGLLVHDFWGQNITLADSHKSYRPFTVLTYRLNYAIHGIDPFGYHAGNVIIYALACVVMYFFSQQWLPLHAARLSAILFCFHPIHVEAVTSIVGRADCLCGLLFLSALVLYSKSIRSTAVPYKVLRKLPNSAQWTLLECLFVAGAVICALLASLAKELGVTIFAVFIVLEVAEFGLCNFSEGDDNNSRTLDVLSSELKISTKRRYLARLVAWAQQFQRAANKHFELTSVGTTQVSVNNMKAYLYLYFARILNGMLDSCDNLGSKCFKCSLLGCLYNYKSRCRIFITLTTFVVFTAVRLRINGEHSLYSWTVMENHIALLPSFQERALSYAQCHFWYFFKLIWPRYLSFDYGYACIPTIHTFFDWRNLLPLWVYALGGYLCLNAIRQVQWSILVAGALLVIPLVPALNILFPVGTTLAERLLFIPSVGVCMMVSYFICHPRMDRFWLGPQTIGTPRELMSPLLAASTGLSGEMSVTARERSSVAKRTGVSLTNKTTSKTSAALTPTTGTPVTKGGSTMNAFVDSASHLCSGSENTGQEVVERDAKSLSFMVTQRSRELLLFRQLTKFLLLPVCSLAALRILSRNIEWSEEMTLYRSALDVCPLSVKALSNYASLTLAHDRSINTVIASDLATQLYSDHVAARVNHAYAQQQFGNLITSMVSFSDALHQVNINHGKAWGSIGSTLEALATRLQSVGAGKTSLLANTDASPATTTATAVNTLRMMARDYIDHGIRLGYYPPNILHIRGSIALGQRNYEEALFYLQLSLKENEAIRATASISGSVHLVDLVIESLTLNQLGNVYLELNNYPEALKAFEAGLALDPMNVPLHVNLALITRIVKGDDAARSVYLRAVQVAEESKQTIPLALLNNLGILELETRRPGSALVYFAQALSSELGQPFQASAFADLYLLDASSDARATPMINELLAIIDRLWNHYRTGLVTRQVREHGEMRVHGGVADILDVLQDNINRAKEELKVQVASVRTVG